MVTMQQVADRAGVSISTVSFVVNGTKPVSADTRERILAAIDELGYRRNALARALATRRSRVIAMIHPIINRNLSGFVEAAANVAAKAGYSLVLWPIHTDNQAREVSSLTTSGMAEGVLLLEVQYEDERVAALEDAGAPFVLIGRTRDLDGRDFVDIDFEGTVATVLERFASLGHRHIALVVEDLSGTELADYAPPLRTADTFRREIAARGLSGSVFLVPRVAGPGDGLADRIAEEAPETTAVLLMHGEAAFGLVNDLQRRGIVIPRDLSLVAIAVATDLTVLLDPPITTYETPATEMGRIAAEALIARLKSGDATAPTQELVRCELRDGATIAPAPLDRPALRVGGAA